ncbi:IclR family transcriptional regulator [Cupriavidus campinensis]|uniref:IclR family transcriptional regulator n=1 Tax=Cupriavidus campinensis TaxID=151783 RepID=UPI0024E20D8D|nr:IclR family transcriptional regulator [Cupriavidus campinensis]
MAPHPPQPPAPLERDRQFATTLARGIDILLAYRPGESLLGNRDFVLRTGLSKSTVARLTHTLAALGYLRHDVALGKYRLGAAVLAPAYPLLCGMPIRQLARPLMQAMAGELGGAVSLGIRDRTQMIYVETALATPDLAFAPDVGAAMPMLASAIGKAWLCRAPAKASAAVLNRLRLEDPEAYHRAAPALAQARKDLARHGYCTSRGEWRPDVFGFAVPLCARVDSRWFVIHCGVLAQAGAFHAVEKVIGPRLVALANQLEMRLGLR